MAFRAQNAGKFVAKWEPLSVWARNLLRVVSGSRKKAFSIFPIHAYIRNTYWYRPHEWCLYVK